MARSFNADGDARAGQPGRVAIGSNPERNRLHNRRVVLEAIRLHGALGRTEIARRTRLTAQAVANIVGDLVAEGFLIETGRLRAGRGLPPIQFAINPEGPLTAGVEIAADRLTVVLLDLKGGIRAQSTTAAGNTAPGAIVPRVAAEIARLRQSIGAGAKLLGVGVVMPGPFEIEGMSSVGPATLPGWRGIDAAAMLTEALGETVIVENDATAAAVGERLHGAGRTCQDFCFIYFGVGIGLGIIHEGRPMRGAFGNAGELGHVAVPPRGRPGLAGGDATLERIASVYALRERLAAAGRPAHRIEDLADCHHAGDPVLAEWIANAADYLSPVVGLLENILDPETIILGGNLPDGVIDALIAALDPLPVTVATRRERALPRVMRGQTGQLTAALGAAALPLFETVTPRLHLMRGAASGDGDPAKLT